MEKIMELNNLAVTCMGAKQFKEAVHNLVWALELGKDLFYRNPPLSDQSAGNHHHDIPSHPSSHHHVVGTSTIVVGNNSNSDGHDHLRNIVQEWPFQYSSAIKYQHPFRMFPDDMIPSSSSSLPYSRSSSTPLSNADAYTRRTIGLLIIVLFNLALCHDQMASSSSTSTSTATSTSTTTIRQQVLMAKAVALYEKVVELHLQSTMMDSNGDHYDLVGNTTAAPGVTGRRHASMVDAQQDMVVMAAMNNLVQWHQESHSSSSSSLLTSSLLSKETYLSIMMMQFFQEIQQTVYPTDEISTLVDSQARVFVANLVLASNTHMTCLCPLAVSAAAA